MLQKTSGTLFSILLDKVKKISGSAKIKIKGKFLELEISKKLTLQMQSCCQKVEALAFASVS